MKKKAKLFVAGLSLVLLSGGIYLEATAQREVGYKKWNNRDCCSGTGNCMVSDPGAC